MPDHFFSCCKRQLESISKQKLHRLSFSLLCCYSLALQVKHLLISDYLLPDTQTWMYCLILTFASSPAAQRTQGCSAGSGWRRSPGRSIVCLCNLERPAAHQTCPWTSPGGCWQEGQYFRQTDILGEFPLHVHFFIQVKTARCIKIDDASCYTSKNCCCSFFCFIRKNNFEKYYSHLFVSVFWKTKKFNSAIVLWCLRHFLPQIPIRR